MRWIAIAFCASIALAAAATGPAGVTSTERLANGRFVFSICDPQSIDGYCTLAVSDPTGGRRRTTLSEDGGVYGDADWSPDGTKIAYSLVVGSRYTGYTADVYVANADGSGVRRLVTGPQVDRLWPSWSPDGRQLAYAEYAEGWNIYVVDADGSDGRLLTAGFDPAWSPDGTTIVFARGAPGDRSDLYLMKADGSGARRLTSGPGIDGAPDWSAAGKPIVFQRTRSDGSASIYLVRADGTRLRRLTPNRFDNGPAWSPDGRKIVFSRRGDIYVVNRDGTRMRRITRTRWMDEGGTDWQPVRVVDGTMFGTPFADYLVGGPGRQTMLGGAGNDVFEARDGRPDVVSGGPGFDTAHADRVDRLTDIERRS